MSATGKYLIAVMLGLATTVAQAGAVVTGKDSPISPIDADVARRVFLGLQRNINGQTVSVLFQSRGPARDEFEIKVLGKSGADLTSYMTMLIFTGRALPPIELRDDDSIKQRLNSVPNGVGYIGDQAIDGRVKVLFRY